jgi:uncharacterized protein YecT (DUF1311 family)
MDAMIRPLALALLLSLCAAVPAPADDLYDKCIEESDGTNLEWSRCGGAFIDREDARLNATWKRVLALTSDQTKKDLLAEQRAWNTFKERSCRFYANGEWGREGTVVHFLLCRAAVIADRVKALEFYGEFVGN